MKSYQSLIAISMLVLTVNCTQLLYTNPNLVPNHFGHQQIYTGPHPGIVPAYNQPENSLAHPAVVQNSIAESQLPSELLNPFYKNPVLASALAQESWFTKKEFPVRHREAERISKEEIYKIISRLRN